MLELGKLRHLRQVKDGKRVIPPRVISVTSGKGGVGKSSVVANLAMTLAEKGERVLLLDGDFGLANLDIMLDLKPRGNIHDVLKGQLEARDILARVAPNVDIIPASSGVMEMTQLTDEKKTQLLDVMQSLENAYDVLLIDTGAGISDDVTWLNSSASEIIVVATPEPTSLADAYALIKVLHQKHKVKAFKLLVNQARSEAEALRVYQQITAVSDRFLNVAIDYLGHVLWDDLWTYAVRQRKPIVSAYPSSNAAKNFSQLADTLFRPTERMVANGGNTPFFKALLGHA
ncbi:MAG TPA: MinD/ParA family protein [Bdellovibrionota bacterium]|jgi:flagellar biosynthesis protein FlhG